MINASELRIGNWVRHEEHICKVDAICDYPNEKYKKVSVKGDHLGAYLLFKDIEPIPLSSDILLACGFENDGRKWKHGNSSFLVIDEQGLWVNGKMAGEIKYMLYKSGIGAIKEVKFLHKLQNVFYEVTDEELQIKDLNIAVSELK